MRLVVPAIAIAAFLGGSSGHAFDAAGADIIGLRLGMPAAEVVVRLVHQGYAVDRTQEAITANTLDGRLRVTMSAEQGVTEIIYVFHGRGAGAPAKIQEAVLTRFGDPDQATPPTWCRAVRRDGMCPGDQAALSFQLDSLTLRLVAGERR